MLQGNWLKSLLSLPTYPYHISHPSISSIQFSIQLLLPTPGAPNLLWVVLNQTSPTLICVKYTCSRIKISQSWEFSENKHQTCCKYFSFLANSNPWAPFRFYQTSFQKGHPKPLLQRSGVSAHPAITCSANSAVFRATHVISAVTPLYLNCLLGGTLKLCDGRTVYSGLNPSGGIKISAFNNEGRNKTTTVFGGFKKKST